MNPILPLLTAFATGFTHALAPDHAAAVATFVSRRPRPLESVRFGTRWGLGHSASVLLAGGLLLLLDVDLSEAVARNLERAVGVMLFGLGVWLLWTLAHEVAHGRHHRRAGAGDDVDEEHAVEYGGDHAIEHGADLATALPTDRHHDRRGSFLVGMAHGLAGTAPLIGVIPVAFIEPRAAALGYLLLFSAGTVVAMGIFAGAAGLLLSTTGRASPHLALGLRFCAAIGSTVLGAFWVAGA